MSGRALALGARVGPLAFGLAGRVPCESTYRRPVPDISHNVARQGLSEPVGEQRGRRYEPSEGLRVVARRVYGAVTGEFPVTGGPYRIGATP